MLRALYIPPPEREGLRRLKEEVNPGGYWETLLARQILFLIFIRHELINYETLCQPRKKGGKETTHMN